MADFEDLVDVVEMDAEEEEVKHQAVNLFLVFTIPLLILVTKVTGTLSTRISMLFFRATEAEKKLAQTVMSLKSEMKSISMVDEFAKYAKIQRRLNHINLDLETTVGCRHSMQTKLRRILSVAFYVIIAVSTAVLMYNFRATPVFIIPSNWFYPLSYVLSYPTGIPGAISVVSWTLLIRIISNLLLREKEIKKQRLA